MSDIIHILIIDDNEDDRILYRRTLEKSAGTQYHIVEVSDGDQGLEALQEKQPDCLLLDYSLPGRNGVEVLKRIRSQYPFVPVIMLTGQGNENVAVAAMQEGAQNYISKATITLESFEHIIRMAMEHCQMQKRIYEQRSALEVFTRALAHDLNEPVRTIRSFIELLGQSDEFPDKSKSYFEHIQKAADRMRMLIDTVFLYTRLDNPEPMAQETCDMRAVLQEVQDNLAQLIKEHGATITADALPSVHITRIQLIQVMQNLLSNAISHSKKPVTIHISAQMQGDQWVFSVKDNGPGIEQPYLQKIFAPFKRMAQHEEQGAGLGLAICRKIIELHGGKIWCESIPSHGANFLFSLPAALPASEQPSQAKNEMHPTTDALANKPMANILLVDDNKAFIDIAQVTLMEHDQLQCNLFVARGGEEALSTLQQQASEHPIDLVLLDINMPELDGFEVLERIRADKTLDRTSVVMCTGSNYDKDMEKAKALGAVGYVMKPIELSKLRSVIENMPDLQLAKNNGGYTLYRAA